MCLKLWLWMVMRVKPVNQPGHVLMSEREIVDSFDDPIKAAEYCEKQNEDTNKSMCFLEARPVIATIEAEEGELNGCNVNPTETIPQDDFSDWERN